jgi:hypothetical protein
MFLTYHAKQQFITEKLLIIIDQSLYLENLQTIGITKLK